MLYMFRRRRQWAGVRYGIPRTDGQFFRLYLSNHLHISFPSHSLIIWCDNSRLSYYHEMQQFLPPLFIIIHSLFCFSLS